jgi:hypothetical protein
MDILFEDKFNRKLIIELKAGPIKDEHIGQIMSYEGMLLSAADPTLRVMLVGPRVPPNIKKSMDYHGIAWKEITFSFLKEFLNNKGDKSFNHLFEFDEPVIKKRNEVAVNPLPQQKSYVDIQSNSQLIEILKSSDNYKSFKNITLNVKKEHEEEARLILEKYHGNFNHNHFKEIIELVDGPSQYPYELNGKIVASGKWFGNLLNTPNTEYFFKTDIKLINDWFNVLRNNDIPIEKRIEILQKEPYKIKGIKTGFITLMLYLLDKPNNSVWFKALHEGLQKIYPEIWNFSGKATQYILFNQKAKEFLRHFDFDHTELDWLLFIKFKFSK